MNKCLLTSLRSYILIGILSFCSNALSGQDYIDYIGAGHHKGISITSSNNTNTSTADNTINGHGVMVDAYGASRFLAQTTLGANYEEIHRTAEMGLANWLAEQFTLAIDAVQVTHDSLKQIFNDSLVANGLAEKSLMSPHFKQFAWWQTVMTSDAQLRHRMAIALSELFVISDRSDIVLFPRAFANYYDMLQTNAFGNYRDLFRDVTLHPAMGFYLSHINNRKTDLSINRFPDENYARECMQLFTIGLYELNNDGSRKTDAHGNWIPTFDNTDITEIAKVFTGLGFNYNRFGISTDYAHADYYSPMIMFEEEHEPGEKVLLKKHIIPAGQTGMEDIEDAIDILFHHPNTGPFFCKFLIQRLVTSNPSPGYIDRVATIFNDNGNGIRGDMKAIIKAILLDTEARDCSFREDITYGRMKEPIIKFVEQMRAFNATSPNGSYFNRTGDFVTATGQRVLSSPSVFNFFQSDFQPMGPIRDQDLVAPEFQMLNANTSVGFHNYMGKGFYSDIPFEDAIALYYAGTNADYDRTQGQVTQDFSVEIALLNDPDALIERLDLLLTHGAMSDTTKDTIKDVLTSLENDPHANDRRKIGIVIEMVVISPEYNILR